MTTPYRKKLIEVALPLEAISEESSQRKRKAPAGYPTTFHKWWAQRPIAACRAVLFTSLVDDPDSDPTFRRADGSVDEERAGYRRADLFNLIEELVKWENSNNPSVIDRARAEIAASVASRKILDTKEWTRDQILCNEKAWAFVARLAKPENVNAFLAEFAPPVLDPFAGGGSIPLEAQRLGLRAYASDLNPVPVLINKALIEIPPKFANKPPVNPDSRKQATTQNMWKGAKGLAEDVRYYGQWMRDEAEKRIGHLYPKIAVTPEMARERPDLKPYVGESLTVIAWLWARTVASPNPAVAGAHVPLVRSFWLSTKKGKEAWARPVIDRKNNTYRFEVGTGTPPDGFDPKKGTIVRTGGTCLFSGGPMPFDHIRAEGKAGRIGSKLMAIVAEGTRGRVYLSPTEEHVRVADCGMPNDYPDTDLPKQALSFRVQLYGMDKHYKLFTPRQLTALVTFSDLVGEARAKVLADATGGFGSDLTSLDQGGTGPQAYADAVATYLAASLSRVCDYNTALASWRPKDNAMRSTFAKQALPMVWDFAEANVFAGSSSGLSECVGVVAKSLALCPAAGCARAWQQDARQATSDHPSAVICTDPPYYSNIGYADLSDLLYIWLRRSLATVYPSLLSTLVTPKVQELIASPYRHDGDLHAAKEFFESGLRESFAGVRAGTDEFPTTVFYAFKQSEEGDQDSDDEKSDELVTASTGWETMLAAFAGAGFVIVGTWPMRTEGDNRSVGIGTNALASSIVLVGRARRVDAPLATRREFLNALKRELPEALKHLQRGNIAPVDLAQAAIGPGMAVFTRYARVMEADGSPMKVRQALALINQTLDEVLAEQEGEFDADTRWALAWFEQHAMDEGAFGVAETLSKAKNTAVNALVESGIIAARGGKVRLLKREELPATWDPTTDSKVRHWEVTQHLIRALETGGETAAANLLRRVGGLGEGARDLAYRLYNVCERKKWASEALAYNGLVIAWPEISKLAQKAPVRAQVQTDLFGGGR